LSDFVHGFEISSLEKTDSAASALAQLTDYYALKRRSVNIHEKHFEVIFQVAEKRLSALSGQIRWPI